VTTTGRSPLHAAGAPYGPRSKDEVPWRPIKLRPCPQRCTNIAPHGPGAGAAALGRRGGGKTGSRPSGVAVSTRVARCGLGEPILRLVHHQPVPPGAGSVVAAVPPPGGAAEPASATSLYAGRAAVAQARASRSGCTRRVIRSGWRISSCGFSPPPASRPAEERQGHRTFRTWSPCRHPEQVYPQPG
jgi:hypothetical protein